MISWLPWAVHALEVCIVIVVLACTSANSLIRPALLPVIVALSVYALPLYRHALLSKLVTGSISLNTVGMVFQYLDSVLISRWSFRAGGPTSASGGQHNIQEEIKLIPGGHGRSTAVWERLSWGFFAGTAWRAPATPWEVKNVPPFDTNDRQPAPTRARFLVGKTVTLMLCLLFIDALGLAPQDPAQNTVLFAWKNVAFFSRLRDVSTQDILVRLMVSLVGWTSIYCVLQACYCILAIFSVATNLTPVDAWPPLFGSVGDCYSIRRFWGRFWHQSLRQRIGSPAYYITYSLLGLRRGGLIGRYLNILLTFAVSGLIHIAEEYGTGVPVQKSGSMRFFCTQALGIMLEDAIRATLQAPGIRWHNRWLKGVGYLWFVCWMAWSSPAWLYPKLESAEGGERDKFLPWSMLEMLLRR